MKKSAHKAAIRGLCWDSHNRFHLYSGGGCDDKKLKCWNMIGME